jgi:hypothetical protein
MARTTFINAILSGKLGGAVYSRNKAGSYIRIFVKGTDPESSAQLAVRGNFASALTGWHSLDDQAKSEWNTFAIQHFSPKIAKCGTYSGFNAYTSLRAVALNANRIVREYTIEAKPAGAAVAIVHTTGIFTVPNSAPSLGHSNMLESSIGMPLACQMSAASFSTDATCTFTVDLPGLVTPVPEFTDPVGGLKQAWLLFASNALSQNMQFVQNPYFTILGVIPPITYTSGWPVGGASKIIYTFTDADLNIGAHKHWYSAGQTVQLSLVSVNEVGQVTNNSSMMVPVTAPV